MAKMQTQAANLRGVNISMAVSGGKSHVLLWGVDGMFSGWDTPFAALRPAHALCHAPLRSPSPPIQE